MFAICLSAIMLLGFGVQATTVGADVAFREGVVRWIAPNIAAVILLIVGGFVDGDGRIVLWLISLAIVVASMVMAGSSDWLVRAGHMAERHGLIVIIALGEVIVAIGLPVVNALEAGGGIPGPTAAALAASGAFAALLWWGYFDRPSPALEHHGDALDSLKQRTRFVRDVYTWAHAPVVAGIILSAAALEEIALHPTDEVDVSFRVMLAGGVAMVTLGVAAAVWRAFHAVARERIACAVAVALAVVVAGEVDGVYLLVLVTAVMAVTLVSEHSRIER